MLVAQPGRTRFSLSQSAGCCRLAARRMSLWACGFGSKAVCRSGGRFLLSHLLLIEIPYHPGGRRPSLIIRRHAAELLHTLGAGIVSGQSLHQIEVVALQQLPQIFSPTLRSE